jgi:hypothetical protein
MAVTIDPSTNEARYSLSYRTMDIGLIIVVVFPALHSIPAAAGAIRLS